MEPRGKQVRDLQAKDSDGCGSVLCLALVIWSAKAPTYAPLLESCASHNPLLTLLAELALCTGSYKYERWIPGSIVLQA